MAADGDVTKRAERLADVAISSTFCDTGADLGGTQIPIESQELQSAAYLLSFRPRGETVNRTKKALRQDTRSFNHQLFIRLRI